MSFEEQCNSLAGSKLEWMKPVAGYLKTRNDIAEKLEDDQKSLNKCAAYILQEAKKKGNQVCMTDQEVFGLAVHYYDENIEVIEAVDNVHVSVPHVKNEQDEEMESLMKKIEEKDKEISRLKSAKGRAKKKKKKKEEASGQLSMFDLFGDDSQ